MSNENLTVAKDTTTTTKKKTTIAKVQHGGRHVTTSESDTLFFCLLRSDTISTILTRRSSLVATHSHIFGSELLFRVRVPIVFIHFEHCATLLT